MPQWYPSGGGCAILWQMNLRLAKRVIGALLLAAAVFGLPATGFAVMRAAQVMAASPRPGRRAVAHVAEPLPTPPPPRFQPRPAPFPSREAAPRTAFSRCRFQRPPPALRLA